MRKFTYVKVVSIVFIVVFVIFAVVAICKLNKITIRQTKDYAVMYVELDYNDIKE